MRNIVTLGILCDERGLNILFSLKLEEISSDTYNSYIKVVIEAKPVNTLAKDECGSQTILTNYMSVVKE